jgi:hypothetical protein
LPFLSPKITIQSRTKLSNRFLPPEIFSQIIFVSSKDDCSAQDRPRELTGNEDSKYVLATSDSLQKICVMKQAFARRPFC